MVNHSNLRIAGGVDSDLLLDENFISPEDASEIFWELLSEVFRTDAMVMDIPGQTMRVGAVMQRNRMHRHPLFPDNRFRPFRPTVAMIAGRLWETMGIRFDFCALNLYRTGQDFIAPHVDYEGVWGPRADDVVVATVSLGATRRLDFAKLGTKVPYFELPICDGSLYVMRGTFQRHSTHSISRCDDEHPRLSLTFTCQQRDSPHDLMWLVTERHKIDNPTGTPIFVGPKKDAIAKWQQAYPKAPQPQDFESIEDPSDQRVAARQALDAYEEEISARSGSPDETVLVSPDNRIFEVPTNHVVQGLESWNPEVPLFR